MKINKPVGPYPFWTWDFASQSLWRSPILAEVECCKGQSTGQATSCPGVAAISGNPGGFREDKEVTLAFLRGEKINLTPAFNLTTLPYENPGDFLFLTYPWSSGSKCIFVTGVRDEAVQLYPDVSNSPEDFCLCDMASD